MTVDLDQGTAWVVGAFLAIPALRQALGFFRDLRGPQRDPPLGEEVAVKYATRVELSSLKNEFKADIASLRESIAANDDKAEKRSIDAHRRTDSLMAAACETNRRLGVLIGLNIAQGKAPASLALDDNQEGGSPC